MTRILSKRMTKILPKVIKSVQSCGVKGANIGSSAVNLLSLIEAVKKSGKWAAMASLDLFKAYDRTNLFYLTEVMTAMNFHPTFNSWIFLLHKGAKTRLLLDFLTDTIYVLFLIRQGCPASMVLFTIYIEPLLLRLQSVVHGFTLEAPLQGGPSSIAFESCREIGRIRG